jgi:hypothetical protein
MHKIIKLTEKTHDYSESSDSCRSREESALCGGLGGKKMSFLPRKAKVIQFRAISHIDMYCEAKSAPNREHAHKQSAPRSHVQG